MAYGWTAETSERKNKIFKKCGVATIRRVWSRGRQYSSHRIKTNTGSEHQITACALQLKTKSISKNQMGHRNRNLLYHLDCRIKALPVLPGFK